MRHNLFIIISVKVIGVNTDKYICDIIPTHVWVQTFGRELHKSVKRKVKNSYDFEKILRKKTQYDGI